MDIEYFRNFIMIVDSQTLTEAAKKLSMVQPALSAQLKQIEHNYGARLIITHRGGRRIELTEAGELFYRRAKDLIRLADDLKDEVAHVSAGGSGTLRVAITPGAVQGFIDDYILPFSEAHPEFRCVFYEGNVDVQAEYLLEGLADIGVMNEPISRGYLFDLIHIRYRQLNALIAKDQTWIPATKRELLIKDLAKMPLCVTRSVHAKLEAFFRERGLESDIRSVCSTNALASHWARRGLGVAVIVGDGAGEPGLREVPLAREEMLGAEHMYGVKDRKLTTIAKRFISFIQERE